MKNKFFKLIIDFSLVGRYIMYSIPAGPLSQGTLTSVGFSFYMGEGFRAPTDQFSSLHSNYKIAQRTKCAPNCFGVLFLLCCPRFPRSCFPKIILHLPTAGERQTIFCYEVHYPHNFHSLFIQRRA